MPDELFYKKVMETHQAHLNKYGLPATMNGRPHRERVCFLASRAFFVISENLKFTLEEQGALLGGGLLAVEQLRKNAWQSVSRDQLVRIRGLVQLYRMIMRENGREPARCARLLREPIPSPPFCNTTPLKHMLRSGISGIEDVVSYFATGGVNSRRVAC